jgi:hypothetical protein
MQYLDLHVLSVKICGLSRIEFFLSLDVERQLLVIFMVTVILSVLQITGTMECSMHVSISVK